MQWFAAWRCLKKAARRRIVNVVKKGNELTVLAVSAGWSTRVRYALAALTPELKARAPDIVKITVRVSPTAQSGAARADPSARE